MRKQLKILYHYINVYGRNSEGRAKFKSLILNVKRKEVLKLMFIHNIICILFNIKGEYKILK